MSQDSKIINCTCCDYKTNKKYNLIRHMVRIHPQQNVSHAQQNVSHAQQNVSHTQQNVSHTQQNVSLENDINQHIFECDICYKIFNKQWVLTRHKKNCTGITNSLKCLYCDSVFTTRQAKFKHIKTCNNSPQIQNINNIHNTSNIDNTI